MKVYIKIVETSLSILIDTRVSVCVILEDLVKKLRLKIKANDRIKVVPLGERSKIRIIGLIPNILIAVQNLHTSGLLYVIERIELVIILETDWMDQYQTDIQKSDNMIEV